MLGDIILSCLGGVNQIIGDPLGAYVKASERVEYEKELKRRSEPQYKLAKQKMYLYERVQYYKEQLEWAKQYAPGMIPYYEEQIEKHKQELKLLS